MVDSLSLLFQQHNLVQSVVEQSIQAYDRTLPPSTKQMRAGLPLACDAAGEVQGRANRAIAELQPIREIVEETAQIMSSADDIRYGRLLPVRWQPQASSFNNIQIS